jgi:hypothetical protein
MTLSEYVKKRNGVAIGATNSLRNMFIRSLGAKNFAVFWNYWNPIWGYYLGMFFFKPLKKLFPPFISLLLTFIICGIIHDLAITLIARKGISIFFTIWFFIMGIQVIISEVLKLNFSEKKWILRAIINLLFLIISYSITAFLIHKIKT